MAATKTKARAQAAALLSEPEAAPLARPLEHAEWIGQTLKNMQNPNATEADREEYRKLLDEKPWLLGNGSLETMYFTATREPFKTHPMVDENMKRRRKLMRAELLGPAPSELEKLLVEVVLSAHADYWHFAVMYKQQTNDKFYLKDMEQWERVLNAKEQRYLRAIAELARVRRLLNLPAPQVNINMPGGQQVNVSGKP